LRQTVEQNAFPMVKNITISIGAVEITDQDGTAGVIDQADKALYFAKEHGRNNVCLYRDLASAEAVEQPAESVSGSVDFF
jgi:PleD family two-component response regulator